MSEYRAIYKCRLCGEEFEGMIFGERDSVSCAMALFTSGNDSYAMRYKEPPNILYTKEEHYCKDGSYGLADFLGFRKVEGLICRQKNLTEESYFSEMMK